MFITKNLSSWKVINSALISQNNMDHLFIGRHGEEDSCDLLIKESQEELKLKAKFLQNVMSDQGFIQFTNKIRNLHSASIYEKILGFPMQSNRLLFGESKQEYNNLISDIIKPLEHFNNVVLIGNAPFLDSVPDLLLNIYFNNNSLDNKSKWTKLPKFGKGEGIYFNIKEKFYHLLGFDYDEKKFGFDGKEIVNNNNNDESSKSLYLDGKNDQMRLNLL